jgi:hypothetical protein
MKTVSMSKIGGQSWRFAIVLQLAWLRLPLSPFAVAGVAACQTPLPRPINLPSDALAATSHARDLSMYRKSSSMVRTRPRTACPYLVR